MPNVQITQLPTAGPITGTESVPIVQNGQTVQTTTGAISASPSQTQTFLTLNQEPTLINSRYLSAGTGLGLTDAGAQSYLRITLNGASGSLETALNGIIAKTNSNTVAARTLTASGSGLSITNGDGVSGNPTFALTGIVGAISVMPTPGLIAARDSSTVSPVTITGTSNQISVTNGNGFSGNPTIAIASDPVIPGTGAMTVPIGTTAQQPGGSVGQFRYDSTMDAFYGYSAGAWRQFSLTGGVTLVNTGTGLTGGPITSTGTISIANTGVTAATYGSATESAQIAVNAQGQITSASNVTITPSGIGAVASVSGTANEITATGTTNVTLSLPSALTFTGKTVTGGTFNMTSATVGADTVATLTASQTLTNKTISGSSNTLSNIGNSSLTNSSVTYNGVTVALGASGTITAANPQTLTIGTGLSGGSYDGSSAVTIAIDSTVATLTGSQILTNKTMSGSSNTFSNIGNSSLTNSSVTYNGQTVALGGSGTITATTTNALTAGTGIQFNTGTTFDGSSAKTISIDSTVATLTGSQTLTNKTMSGASNTFSNIGNSSLTNSSVTFNGTTVSLGGSGTITANTTNSLTFNNGGSGAASGTAFNGSTAYTISYNTVGASPLAGSTSLVTVGTITTGTWHGSTIDNAYLTNSAVTVGTTSISLGGSSLTLGGLTSVAVTQDPTTALQLATKQYVDGLASTGLYYHAPVQAATTQSLAAQTGGTVTYNNGTGGVGATITLSVALTTLDGYTLANTNRILVKDETNQAYNGVYTWATGGTVLTRSTDTDSYGPGTGDLSENDYFFVQNGNVNKGTSYVCTTSGTITFGTTAITFAQFSTSQVYSAGTGLTLTNTTFSISNTAVTAAAYGSASSVGTFTVNAQGQLTAAASTSIAINGNQITSGTVGSSYISGSYTGITGVGTLTAGTWNASTIGVGYGGTGLATYTAGDLIYATASTTLAKLGIGTNGQVLTSSGTAPQWTSGSSISVGTATNLAGGTAGAIPYQTGAGATTFLSLGTTNYVLTAGASAPQYVAQSTLSVGSATNATNTGITADSTNATNYLTFVSATTGNLPQLVNSGITCNPSTGKITGGISGGTF